MDLSGLPQFTVVEIHPGPAEGETVLIGRFSHLRGVRNERGWLYRPGAVSIVGDLSAVPTAPGGTAAFATPDAGLAPELRVGAVFPWLDGYWQPYHLDMVLAPPERWARRTFIAEPARYFRLGGLTGWQPADAPLPDGAVDLGVRAGAWDHEHCELCNAHIGSAGEADGYTDPDGYWLCVGCYDRYAARRDVSFAAEA